jgi:two-component system sensor histidine kinase TctE
VFGNPAGSEQRSLFGEILDWMLAPLLLLWPLSIGFTFVIARSLADAPFDRALVDHTNAIVSQVIVIGDYLSVPDQRRLRDLISSTEDDTTLFQISAADGELLAGIGELPPPALYDFVQAGVVKIRTETYRGEEIRIAYTYVDAPDDVQAQHFPVLVQVGETLDRRAALANEIIKGVIFPQFLILPVSVALVWFGLSRGLAPLNRMQRRIRERAPDDLSPIDPRDAPEEVSPLVEAINDLLARLGESIAAQKRFIADAAHQMKTPLAGLRTQSELALRESDPAQLRLSLEQIAISSDRAAHLISQLLALARMENLRDATRLEALDLAPLTRSVASDWVGEATRRSIDFGFEGEDAPMPIAGHPILLREMFNNLIDNALRYTPPGGTVTVGLERSGSEVVVSVEDSGPGIPPAERALVFERFYRVLGTQTDGSGLGLAIVREIAEQHGAEVRIEDATSVPAGGGPGTRFAVAFPAVTDASA